MRACRNISCDNVDGSKGVCAPGDTSDYCIACDDARGGYSKPCPWPSDTCPCNLDLVACCENEKRNMNGGCDNCGDPCL